MLKKPITEDSQDLAKSNVSEPAEPPVATTDDKKSIIINTDIDKMLEEYEQNPAMRGWGQGNFNADMANQFNQENQDQPKKSVIEDKKESQVEPQPDKKNNSDAKKSDSEDNQIPEKISFGAPHLSRIQSENDNAPPTPKAEPEAYTSFLQEPKRVTVVAKNPRGTSMVSHTLRPTLIGQQYYFQVVNEMWDTLGRESAYIVTRDDSGNIISTKEADPAKLGQSLSNTLRKPTTKDKVPKESILLTVMNDKDQIVAQAPIAAKVSKVVKDKSETVEEVVDPKQKKSIVITRSSKLGTTRVSKLRPTLAGNQYFCQTITEETGKNGKKSVILETKNDKGELIDIRAIDPLDVGKTNCTEVIQEKVNPEGRRTFLLSTQNDKGETIAIVEVEPDVVDLAKTNFDQIIEEITDSKDNKKLTVINATQKGEPVVLRQMVRPTVLMNIESPVILFEYDSPGQEQEEIPELDGDTVQPGSVRKTADKAKIEANLPAEVKSSANPNKRMSEMFDLVAKENDPFKRFSQLGKLPAEPVNKSKSKTTVGKAPKIEDLEDLPQANEDQIKEEVVEARSPSLAPRRTSLITNVAKITPPPEHENAEKETEINDKKVPAEVEDQVQKKESSAKKERAESIQKLEEQADEKLIPQEKAKSISFEKIEEPPIKKESVSEIVDGGKKSKIKNISEVLEHDPSEHAGTASNSRLLNQVTEDLPDRLSKINLEKVDNKVEEIRNTLTIDGAKLPEDEKIKKLILEVFQQEMEKMDLNDNNDVVTSSLLDEFYKYCEQKLPHDDRYKESVLFVSMFYYFIEKKMKQI